MTKDLDFLINSIFNVYAGHLKRLIAQVKTGKLKSQDVSVQLQQVKDKLIKTCEFYVEDIWENYQSYQLHFQPVDLPPARAVTPTRKLPEAPKWDCRTGQSLKHQTQSRPVSSQSYCTLRSNSKTQNPLKERQNVFKRTTKYPSGSPHKSPVRRIAWQDSLRGKEPENVQITSVFSKCRQII